MPDGKLASMSGWTFKAVVPAGINVTLGNAVWDFRSLHITVDPSVPNGTYPLSVVATRTSPIETITSLPFDLIVSNVPGPLPRVAPPASNPTPARYHDWYQRLLGSAEKFCKIDSGSPAYGPMFYDGTKVYYDLWDLTGNPKWKECAEFQANAFYQAFARSTSLQFGKDYLAFAEGLYRHWVETGSQNSLDGVANVAAQMRANGYRAAGTWADCRAIANALNAHRIAVHAGLTQYAPDRDLLVDVALTALDVNSSGRASTAKPFMLGLLYQALIKYYEEVSPDPRIPAGIKANADWLWQNAWRDDSSDYLAQRLNANKGMLYTVSSPFAHEALEYASPGLNGLVSPVYAWLYKMTGDTKYRNRFDLMMESWPEDYDGGVATVYKFFGESYRWTIEGMRYLDQALVSPPASDTTSPSTSLSLSQSFPVSKTLTLTASATDNRGISDVQFFALPNADLQYYNSSWGWGNGWQAWKYIGRVTTSPYATTIDTNRYLNGSVRGAFMAVACDARRNCVSSILSGSGANLLSDDTVPPSPFLQLNGKASRIYRVNQSAAFYAGVTDNTNNFLSLEVRLDGAPVPGCERRTSTSRWYNYSFTCSVDPSQYTNGVHRLEAVGYDERGNTRTATYTLVTMGQNLVGPLDETGYPATSTKLTSFNVEHGQRIKGLVPLMATVSDPNGVYGVQYAVDDIRVSPIITSAPYAYTLDATKLSAGTHRLTVYAFGSNYGYTASSGTSNVATTMQNWINPNAPTIPERFIVVGDDSLSPSAPGNLAITQQ